MANELKYHMNMLNSIDRQVGGPGNWTYIIDALNSIDQGLTSYIPDQRQAIADYVEQVIESIPPEYSVLKEQAYNAYPTGTLTGNTLYFDDGANGIPVKSLVVNLPLIQSGSGTPSPTNVRQITTYDSVNVFKTGKNVLKWSYSPGYTITKNGVTFTVNPDYSVTVTGTATANADLAYALVKDLPNGTVYLTGGVSVDCQQRWNVPGSSGADIGNGSYGVKTGDITTGNIWIRVPSGSTVNTVIRPMVRVLDTATPIYSAPRGVTAYPYTFSETLCSGTLNLLTGVLTIDKHYLWLDPTKIPDNYIHFDVLNDVARIGNLLLDTHFGLAGKYFAKYDSPNNFRNGAVSNWSFERNKGYSSNTAGFYFSSNRAFYLFCEKSIFATQDAAGFKQYLTNNPLYICYTLANPITYQLAPSEVTTLLMGNTIWTDNGEISLTYRADTTTVINKLKEA